MNRLSEILLETKDLTKQFGHHKAVDCPVRPGEKYIYLDIPERIYAGSDPGSAV